MTKNRVLIQILFIGLINIIVNGKARRRAISKSKIKNSIAIKKNRKEKGRRGDLIGSNPHS